MSGFLEKAYSEFKIGGLLLKNRFIKTATHEGMTPGGQPTRRLIEFHRRTAAGGVALTTVAYGGVNEDGLTHDDQMVIREELVPVLKDLADAVHKEGGRVSMQLTHCGYFSKSSRYRSKRPLGPSPVLNKYGLMKGRGWAAGMNIGQIEATVRDFAKTAQLLLEAGFDALEIHMGHGYLLSQFLSPGINKRKDGYGGSLQNRLRLPLEVLGAVREVVRADFPLLCKINMSDGFRGGLEPDEALIVASALEEAGADALVLSAGYTSRTPFYLMRGDVPLREMIRAEENPAQKLAIALFGRQIIKSYDFKENFFLNPAVKFREKLHLPLVYVGGISSSRGIEQVMAKGFDMIAIGRALIHDPDFVLKARQNIDHISPCNHCNICVAEIESKGVRCVID